MTTPPDRSKPGLLTTRTAWIFAAALLVGTAATVLSQLADPSWAQAILTGGAGFAGAAATLNQLIGYDNAH